MHEQDKAILKSLVSVAWADGRVTSEETDIIEALLQAFEATAEDKFKIEPFVVFEFDAAKRQMAITRAGQKRVFTKEE